MPYICCSSSERAVSSITGIWLRTMSDLIFLHSSNPFISGIITSLATIETSSFINISNASTPFSATKTRKFCSSSFTRKFRMSASSSTSRTV